MCKFMGSLVILAALFMVGAQASASMVFDIGTMEEGVAVSVDYLGSAPADSDAAYRWYSSYADRFEIGFEWVQGSMDVSNANGMQATQDALDTWEDVDGSSIMSSLHTYDGDWAIGNDENEIGWLSSQWNAVADALGVPRSVPAFTITYYSTTTLQQLESDLLFNDWNYYWYTDADDAGYESQYVEHIVLHELGHAFSLIDLYSSADAARTMYAYTTYRNEDVTLDLGDEAALAYAYPGETVPAPGALLLGIVGIGLVGAARRRR